MFVTKEQSRWLEEHAAEVPVGVGLRMVCRKTGEPIVSEVKRREVVYMGGVGVSVKLREVMYVSCLACLPNVAVPSDESLNASDLVETDLRQYVLKEGVA